MAAVQQRGPIGLLLDLDGTISEIVPQPDGASVSLHVKTALRALHRRLSLVAIITGRSAKQARDIVGLQELVYVGNHGLERLKKGRVTLAEEARSFAPFLEQLLSELQLRFRPSGLFFEDKGSSFAIHYRQVEDPERAREKVLLAIKELAEGQVKILLGKTVINVLPPIDVTKGTAVVSLVEEYGLSSAILIGDDVTDIDSFRSAAYLPNRKDFASISIAVVGSDSPEELEQGADFILSKVSEVEYFLKWLAAHTSLPQGSNQGLDIL